MPTRVGLLSLGSSSITLETWIGPSLSTIPPTSPPRWASLTERGRSWRLTMFKPSTYTKPRPIQNTSRMGAAGMTPGGVVEKPAPLPVGNVMIVCPVCNRPTRVGIRDKDSHGQMVKVRVCKRQDCGEEIDR